MMLCDHCGRPGNPYEYRGERYPGLTGNRGERLCPTCLDRVFEAEINGPVGWAQVPAHHYAVVRSPTGYER